MRNRDSGLLIVDVDNTVYDWVGIWARAFEAMTKVLSIETAREASYWHAAMRDVHIRRRALECPGALVDLIGEPRWAPFVGREGILLQAASVYRRTWDTQLAPYEGIRDALVHLTEHHWQIVAYTESDAAVTATRLARMGMASLIPRVFGRAPFSAPVRRDWALIEVPARVPITIDQVPRADMKPNPAGLRDIVVRCGGELRRAVCVGDSLWKDVAMAQRLGVRAVWAKYGTARRAQHMALVESVAYWSAADLAAERAAEGANVIPDATVESAVELVDAVAGVPLAIG